VHLSAVVQSTLGGGADNGGSARRGHRTRHRERHRERNGAHDLMLHGGGARVAAKGRGWGAGRDMIRGTPQDLPVLTFAPSYDRSSMLAEQTEPPSLPQRQLRVLFMHGLESGPRGSKAKLLGRHFDLLAPDMEMSLWRLDRRRSILRNVSSLPHSRSHSIATGAN
jgi:hypothetical protein